MKKMNIFVIAVLMTAAMNCPAGMIKLSNAAIGGVSPLILAADMVFTLTGDKQLTIDVTNNNNSSTEYKINAICFNVSSRVTGLTMTEPSGNDAKWSLERNMALGSYGTFDFVAHDQYINGKVIRKGTTKQFVFTISGTVSKFAESDFIGQTTSNNTAYAAAEFFANSNNPVYGIQTIPEPATIAILAIGGMVMLRRKHGR